MAKKVVPMIHVPDVRATVDWYQSIGFSVINTYGNDGDGLSFAILSFGNSEVMFNQGGGQSRRFRREVDLYVYTDNVDEVYQSIKDRVGVVEAPHDTFYGMRELIVRDLNRFWITFGQSSPFEVLMTAVREGDTDQVRVALNSGGLKRETLTAALAVALAHDHKNPEMVETLKQAGAIAPPEIAVETLQSYAGKYKSELGFEINVVYKERKLFAGAGLQEPMSLMAIDEFSFKPIHFDNYGILTFNVEGGKSVSCTLNHGSDQMKLQRVVT